ncbi:hypothetical protein FCM35_KLT18709 [Carex littledalei]|uniref:Uncharacterized protein n=1 Tax=Carex littledalei TaxID=544730 RepID=A0A833RFM5_9POAL|nr:hypothetical protein FCM35_KLT18709 [Carex littledalei]
MLDPEGKVLYTTALMPGDEETMSDQAIWETLPLYQEHIPQTENILIKDGIVKVADMGLAKGSSHEASLYRIRLYKMIDIHKAYEPLIFVQSCRTNRVVTASLLYLRNEDVLLVKV